jgi:hypothetical protein
MKTYRVFKHRNNGLKAVKVGFSWPALSFGLVWLMSNNLWTQTALWASAAVILLHAGAISDIWSADVIRWWIALNILPFFMGNDWRHASLREQGYEAFASVCANASDEALSYGRAALAVHYECELCERMKPSRAPVSYDLTNAMQAPQSVKPWMSRRNTPWGIGKMIDT